MKERVHCYIEGCRRSVRLDYFTYERTEADGWAIVRSSYGWWHIFLCPLHRLELEEKRSIKGKK